MIRRTGVVALTLAIMTASAGTALAATLTKGRARTFVARHSNRILPRFHQNSSQLSSLAVENCRRRGPQAFQCEFVAGYDNGTQCFQKVRVVRTHGHLRLRFVRRPACTA
jgi:hypothetical protein